MLHVWAGWETHGNHEHLLGGRLVWEALPFSINRQSAGIFPLTYLLMKAILRIRRHPALLLNYSSMNSLGTEFVFVMGSVPYNPENIFKRKPTFVIRDPGYEVTQQLFQSIKGSGL